jgi:transposase
MGKVVAKALLEAAQNSMGVLQRQPALATKVSILGERITTLTAAIEGVEKEIAELFHKLPNKPEDFPIADIPSLATLISETEDIHRFATLKQFLSHFGSCPQSLKTGNYRLEHPRMSHAGNKYIRRVIWMLSIAAIRSVSRYQAYFQRRVEAGKAKMHVIVAVDRKLLSVFYAILKMGLPYHPNWEANRHFARQGVDINNIVITLIF